MFDFARKPKAEPRSLDDCRRAKGPITIGFEQLEGREMLSIGVVLTIIPTETRPLMSMPRPYVSSFNPESPMVVSYRTEPEESDLESPSTPFWRLGGRFRLR